MLTLQRRLREARTTSDRGDAYLMVGLAFGGICLLVAFIFFLVWEGESFGSTDGGHVAVIRNGGPFDNHKIRQVLPAGSGRTNIGMFSSQHNYPTSQRFFTISSTGNGDSDDVVVVPTADGINVGIEGTAYFTLNTSSVNKYAVLKDFDSKYGTRQFRCLTGGSKYVYDGDDGFSCFLDQIVSPVINNDLRVAIGDLRCADLQAACSLVQNSTGTTPTQGVDPNAVGQGNVNLAKIERNISTSLQSDLNDSLGGNYLIVERFNLAKVDLPKSVQDAIETAQSQYAQVSGAQAAQKKAVIDAQTKLKEAQIDAQTNETRQKGYNNCPTCAQIDVVKSLPQGITVYAPGNTNVAIPTN